MAKRDLIGSEQEINVIRGRITAGAATADEVASFLQYVSFLEDLVDQASCEDFYGTDGWKHWLGWDG